MERSLNDGWEGKNNFSKQTQKQPPLWKLLLVLNPLYCVPLVERPNRTYVMDGVLEDAIPDPSEE